MKNKFTLVELLVVIAVIVLLAGILLPSLTMALRKAEKIECTNSMKQSGTLFASYVNDYKETFPDDAYGTSEPRKDTSTQRLFSELYLRKDITSMNPTPADKKWYISNNAALAAFPKIFKCKTGYFAQVAAGGNGCNNGETSMGISFNQSAYTVTMGGYGAGVKIKEIIRPSLKVAAMDGARMSIDFWNFGAVPNANPGYNFYIPGSFGPLGKASVMTGVWDATGRADIISGRHTGTLNILAFDGHVESQLSSLVASQYHRASTTAPKTAVSNMFNIKEK